MNKRFVKLKRLVKDAIVIKDVFGLKQAKIFNVLVREFEFKSNPEKVRAFQSWFTEQVNANVLTTDVAGKPWTATYVESAYRKGLERAYTDTNKVKPDFYTGTRQEFISSTFYQPELVSKFEMVSLRAFEELKGVTNTMSQQMGRILAQGIADGWNPLKIARELTKNIDKLTRTRARVLARTEMIRAHAEGQLDAFETLGVEEVGIMAEFSTAQDERVCPDCEQWEGQIMSIAEARGIIPVHPNCRCAWIPFTASTAKAAA